MLKPVDYFCNTYKTKDTYDYKKARHTVSFVFLIIFYSFLTLFGNSFYQGKLPNRIITEVAPFFIFVGILFIIRKGNLMLAINSLMSIALLMLIEFYPAEYSLLFYAQSFLALLIGTAIYLEVWQLIAAYIVILTLATARHLHMIIQVFESPAIRSLYLEHSAYALIGLYFFFVIMLLYHYIIEKEINNTIQLEHLAVTDALTGLRNRRAVHEYMNKCPYENNISAVCLIDLDYFKTVNDTYGHQIGDKCLVSFARELDRTFSPDHYIYRWGGEEFVILFRNMPISEAESLLNNLRKSLLTTEIFDTIILKFSAGLVASNKTSTLESHILEADNTLYKAKENGRNQTLTSQMEVDYIEFKSNIN